MSLDQGTLDYLQNMLWVAVTDPLRVVEFGSGFSTAVLLEYAASNALSIDLDSFDHDPAYAHPVSRIRPIGEWDAATYAALCDGTLAPPVPHHTPATGFFDTPRHFYALTPEDFRYAPYHLAVCDGAHGSGRSLAFPWLVGRLAPGAFVVIDDYDHYDFEGVFCGLFPGAVVRYRRWTDLHRTVIYEVPG